MDKKFLKYQTEQGLPVKGVKILLAVSGGVDSVIMCNLYHKANTKFGIAHCNFKLRGEEANGDEDFVRKLAEKYDVFFHAIRFNTQEYASQHKLSIQMAARELRYEWLEQVRKENQYTFIATAHHANDVAETVLYNLAKGTGIAGLHGILPKKGKIIRPLLFATKEQIEKYASQHSLEYRTDTSNTETKYNRNKIRHKVVPVLKEINPVFEDTMLENTDRFKEVEVIYKIGLEQLQKQLLEKKGKEWMIPIRKLQKIPVSKTLLYEILKEFGFSPAQTSDVMSLLEADSGKVVFSGSHQVVRDRKHLIIGKKTGRDATIIPISEGTEALKSGSLHLKFRYLPNINYAIPRNANIASLDLKNIRFPLILRHWRRGDYFYPFGMKRKKKKISRFFKDLKLSILTKEKVWILTDSKHRILWVVGYRPDERFKVKESTKDILQIKLVSQ